MRVFLTHNPEDLDAYYGRALPELQAIATVIRNPTEFDLSTPELIDTAEGCDVIVAHRSTPGEASLFAGLPHLIAMLRCAVDISTIDVDAASASGVVVAHAEKSYLASTAELALGLFIDVSRHIASSTEDYRHRRSGLVDNCGARPPGSSDTDRSVRIWPTFCWRSVSKLSSRTPLSRMFRTCSSGSASTNYSSAPTLCFLSLRRCRRPKISSEQTSLRR